MEFWNSPQEVPLDGQNPGPLLEAGTRLMAAEFLERYERMQDLKKAELIEGVVYIGPPVGTHSHGRAHALLTGWAATYAGYTPLMLPADSTTVKLGELDIPQPDILLLILPEAGGQTKIVDDFIVGPPEWVGEVTASSADYDLHEKLTCYQRHGVREYVVWRVQDREIDWLILRNGRYERLELTEGLYRSTVFPGLWLDPAALIANDIPRVSEVLYQGLATPEHTAFVERLQAATQTSQPPES